MTPCVGGGCTPEVAHYSTKLTPERGQDRAFMRELAVRMAKKLQDKLGSGGSAKATNTSGSSWEVSAHASCQGVCGKQKLVQLGCEGSQVTPCRGCNIYSRT